MTHTEESLMALVNEAINSAEAAMADHCSPMGSPSFRYSNAQAREDEAALRLAIREVLAERDEWKRIADDRLNLMAENKGALHWKERAEKAEAECERLRKDAERWKGLRKLAGFVEDGSNETVRLYQDDATKDWFVSVGKCNWFGSSLSAAIDAALKEQP